METQEVYNIEKGVKEVVITHKKGLDEFSPLKINISGNIDSARKWLEKRHVKEDEIVHIDEYGLVNDNDSHLLIDRDKMYVSLFFNEDDPYHSGLVNGSLKMHEDCEKWKINSGESWDHKELSEFIKMNRSCFINRTDAMKLSSALANVKIKADNEYEKSDDNRGTVKTMIAQNIIESNIPKSFTLNVPIFKGEGKTSFEVEVYVSPSNYSVTLVSPDVNDIISDTKNNIIDAEIKSIETIAPGLAIIEV